MSYSEPSWAKPPPSEFQWDLLEVKNGVEISRHKLSNACILLGRATDMVQIPIYHESASRQHARIAFDSQGIPWLRDLKSTHGTTCNKRPLPQQAIGKIEYNSNQAGTRGIMLFPGDILRFGASTRLFCLEGPPEFERAAMKAKQLQAEITAKENQHKLEQNQAKPRGEGISWGIAMDEDDEEEKATEDKNKTLPMDMQVPEKHRKAFERLNALKYKLSNLQTEDGRIRRKGELTEGQERQLQRNADKEETLKKTIVDLEEELYDKLHPEKAGTKKKVQASVDEDEDYDDDFFDRTKQQDDSGIDAEESEKSLIVKWKNLFLQQKYRKERTLPQAQSRTNSIATKLAKLKASGDEEAFFVENDLQLAKESLDKISEEQKKASLTMTEIERLLKIVNNKLNTNRQTGYIGEGPPPALKVVEATEAGSSTLMLPPPVRPKPIERNSSTNGEAGKLPMPPPPPIARKLPTASSPTEGDDKKHSLMPPPKRKRVAGPSMPPPSFSASSGSRFTNDAQRQIDKRPQGTLAFITTMAKQRTENSSEPSERKGSKPVKNVAIDPKRDEWRAPIGQDGSGMTKLNAKFAGRY